MFTGLIEEMGEVTRVRETSLGKKLEIRAATILRDLREGDSLAVNGVCQTLAGVPGPDRVEVVAVAETLRRTTFSRLGPGSRVNLERPLRLGDRLGGHWVNGHVDGTGGIEAVERIGRDLRFTVSVPADLARYVVEKGSVAVDGVSLTVGRVEDSPSGEGESRFTVHIIPETASRTLFGRYAKGDRVNLEVDILAKYVERALGMADPGRRGEASGLSGWSSAGGRRVIEAWSAEEWKEDPRV